ncbi:hypothetical protein KM043_012397 [Ampulex compressa]|nr:hypothetical protein KM043_012397 [Ampulex compressa]
MEERKYSIIREEACRLASGNLTRSFAGSFALVAFSNQDEKARPADRPSQPRGSNSDFCVGETHFAAEEGGREGEVLFQARSSEVNGLPNRSSVGVRAICIASCDGKANLSAVGSSRAPRKGTRGDPNTHTCRRQAAHVPCVRVA